MTTSEASKMCPICHAGALLKLATNIAVKPVGKRDRGRWRLPAGVIIGPAR
jgi:hypothetical protein